MAIFSELKIAGFPGLCVASLTISLQFSGVSLITTDRAAKCNLVVDTCILSSNPRFLEPVPDIS